MSGRSQQSTSKRAARPPPKLANAVDPGQEVYCSFKPAEGSGRVCGTKCLWLPSFFRHILEDHLNDPALRSDVPSLMSYGLPLESAVEWSKLLTSRGVPAAPAPGEG